MRLFFPSLFLFGGALALRFYRLTADPLWLDEIYSVQVGQRGFLGLADP